MQALTNFTVHTGDRLVDEWNTLFGELFVRCSARWSYNIQDEIIYIHAHVT